MPTLEWIGKEKVINHHQEVPFRVLDRRYSFDESGQHAGDNGSENMIIHGDNLEALKALLPRYEGRVKCIYIDPPYNTGNENWVYNDNVNDPKIKKWLGEVVGKEGEDLTRHDKWLCMMYPRLKLLQKLLAEDGAIFISIDDTEYANLKLICDEIFGSSNYRATLIWHSRQRADNRNKTMLSIDHEYILAYSKSDLFSLKAFKKIFQNIRILIMTLVVRGQALTFRVWPMRNSDPTCIMILWIQVQELHIHPTPIAVGQKVVKMSRK